MKPPKLSPVPEGTNWPSGSSIDLALVPLTMDDLAERLGMPLLRGIEDGLGHWAALGGRLPSGIDVEFICYAHIPHSVILRVDKHAPFAAALDVALALLQLSCKDLKS